MHIQISWFLQKLTDLDLHCLQKQGISGFSRTRVTERSRENFMRSVFNDANAILFSVFFMEAYVVVTRLNCLDLLRQFK